MHQIPFLDRTALLLGEEALERIKTAKVAIFGLGGVGSWCAESLVRTGIGELMIVDSDRIAASNINRQLMATSKTVGRIKVEALAQRFLEINPEVKVEVRPEVYNAASSSSFPLDRFDYVIDAIDSLSEKASLIRQALSIPSVTLFASMGAARKLDPFQIRASEFRKIAGDALARALRQKFKRTGGLPVRKFTCVWSPEQRENLGKIACSAPADTWSVKKACPNGSVAHTTAIFGFALAGLVVRHRIEPPAQADSLQR